MRWVFAKAIELIAFELARCLRFGTRQKSRSQSKNPLQLLLQGVFWGNSLTMSYFHTGNPHYHRR